MGRERAFTMLATGDVQDQNVNPKVQDHVSFRTCINPRAVKAAEKVGGAAAQYAGLPRNLSPAKAPLPCKMACHLHSQATPLQLRRYGAQVFGAM